MPEDEKPQNVRRTTRGSTPRHARPRVQDRRTGWTSLLPASKAARVALVVIILMVVKIIIFDLRILNESIVNSNYYDDPAREYAADIVDSLADGAVRATPDSANDSINRLRESLTGRSKWANTVIDAEQYWGLDTSATKLILSIIQVESGGDENVDYLGNIMQVTNASEHYTYIVNGVPEAGVAAGTPQASIYAGTKIIQDALAHFSNQYGYNADMSNHPQAALVAQGYNYGYLGWINYCHNAGLNVWNAWAAQNYQATVMNGAGSSVYGSRIIEELDKLG